MDDRISAKELRSRCGMDDAMFTVGLRREVDDARDNEEYPGGECIGDGNDDAVEGGLVVWGGVSPFRGKRVEPSDETCGEEAL